MRNHLILLPILALATPALAQPAPPPDAGLQRALTDPATVDRVADAMQAMSQAILDLPIGNVEAAVEGRRATPSDRNKRVRDIARLDPRELQRRIAEARPQVERSMRAFSAALPQIMDGLQRASDAIDRAAANLPDPNYPRR